MAETAPIVNTKNGALKGSIFQGLYGDPIYSFEGIPYAKPPVGTLRFADPVAIESWEGVKSAEKAPPVAATVQMPLLKDVVLPESSEDCLFLNIFTPKRPAENLNLPVMVYIHGGGFTFGNGNKDSYGPDYLVPHGVILVNINYRLGALGFLSLQTPECPGNFGLKDQSLGMRWVKENISAFGGDPNNITLFGESAGAASVHYHILSPLSRGLFHRAIAQSGSALNRWAYSRYPRESAILLATKLGCKNPEDVHEAFKFLQNAPLDEINKHAGIVFTEIEGVWAGENILNFSFVPTKEPEGTPNPFLTKTPKEALEDGDYADIPYIAGACSEEAIFALPKPDYVPNWNNITEFEKMLPKELGIPLGSKKSIEAAEKLKQFYFPNGATQEGFLRASSMIMFGYGIYESVKKMAIDSNKKSSNYFYIFSTSRQPSMIKKWLGLEHIKGTSHGDDIEFMFPIRTGLLACEPIKDNTFDRKVQKTLTTLFTNFAKTGKVDTVWNPVSSNNEDPYVDITDKLEYQKGFFAEDIKFWDELYKFMQE